MNPHPTYPNGNGHRPLALAAHQSGASNGERRADYVWLDGELVPDDQATVHLLNPTLHYGPGVFEDIRCHATPRGPAVFRLRDHLRRFLDAIHILGVPADLVPYTLDELRLAVLRTVIANRFDDCILRPILYFRGPLQLNLDDYRPALAIVTWRFSRTGDDAAAGAGRVMVSSFTRHPPRAGRTGAGITGQYLDSVLARTLARRSGCDEAILLDPDGYVAAYTGEHLFLVRDGALHTTPRAPGMEGIARDTVLTLAADVGLSVVEQPISRDMLYVADEAFGCSTATDVAAVREIDFREIGDGRVGPVTASLRQRYREVARGETRRATAWLDYVMMEPLY